MATIFKQQVFSLDMSFSRQEFISLLGEQKKLVYQRTGNVIEFDFLDQRALITLGQESSAQVLSLRQERIELGFDFSSMTRAAQEQFMHLFLLKFQRGGA